MQRWTRRYSQGLLFLILFLCLPSFVHSAESILVRAEAPAPPPIVSVQTFAGAMPAHLLSVNPSAELAVVILADTFSSEELPPLREQLTALFQAAAKSHSFALVLVKGQTVRRLGSLNNLPKFQEAIRELGKQVGGAPVRCKLQAFERLLSEGKAGLGSNWPSVLVLGRFEEVSGELQPWIETSLSEQVRARQLRLTYWGGAGERCLQLEGVARSSGGMIAPIRLSDYADFLDRRPQSFALLSWTSPTLREGFHFYRASLLDFSGNIVDVVPALAIAAGREIPSMEICYALRGHVDILRALCQELTPTSEQRDRIRIEIEQALAINPLNVETLRLGASHYRRSGQPDRLSVFLDKLVELEPNNDQLLAELGHVRLIQGDLVQGEGILRRAWELQPGNSQVAEDLARISAARQDYKSALALAARSLAVNNRNQDLWFWCAGLWLQVNDWVQAADAFEQGLALGGSQISARTALIHIYLEHKNSEKALRNVRAAVGTLPGDAALCGTYADFLERLEQKDEALQLWDRALEAGPLLESAHFRKTSLLLSLNDPARAVRAAEAGLAAAPGSARIHLAKAEAEEKLGRWYEARRTLQAASATISDPQLLGRYAQVEDTYGRDAPRCYQMLAEVLDKTPADPLYIQALERGFQVSLRDDDLDRAQWFASRLIKIGRGEYGAILSSRPPSRKLDVTVPGGTKALMFIASGKMEASRERFFARYSRIILEYLAYNSGKTVDDYIDSILEHFRCVTDLEALGVRAGATVTIQLSTADSKSRQITEQALRLLGWKLLISKKTVKLEGAEEGATARRRLTATSLDIDEVAMQEALQSGQAFKIEIKDDRVPVLFGENIWRVQFYANKTMTGGFAEALLRNPNLAKIYVGLEALEEESASAMLRDIGLKQLSGKYADLLYYYSMSMAVIGNHAMLPGGDRAASIWEQLVGVKPSSAGAFFRALLEKDEGKLLAFYFNLTQLDSRHQEFFTRSLTRTRQYYDLFKDSPDVQNGAAHALRDTPFMEFIQNVPLDGAGRVRFPGSPEVWMVAHGQSDSADKTSRLLRKVAKVTTPEVEDEVLVRLMRTSYSSSSQERSELDNFLAVSSLESHRATPFDERAALILAQEFRNYATVWPYFAMLPGLGADEYEKIFAMGYQMQHHEIVLTNDLVGQWHSLIELLCLLQQRERINDQQGRVLFSMVCDRIGQAKDAAELTSASLAAVREILQVALKEAPLDPDAAIEELLFEPAVAATIETGDPKRRLEAARSRRENYRRVLELQKATPLRSLFGIYDTARRMTAGSKDPGKELTLLESYGKELLTVEIPESIDARGANKEMLLRFQPKDVEDMIAKMRSNFANRKVNLATVQRLSSELLATINPQVKIALAGIIYACYLNANDLLVSADALLLRKHQFVPLKRSQKAHVPFYPSEIITEVPFGSFFVGGFDDFGSIAGRIAFNSAKREDDKIQPFFVSQMSSLRTALWDNLRDEDLRLVGLKICVAREWMIQSAERPQVFFDLADAVSGLLSFARKADLLRVLGSKDWRAIWEMVTLGDLYHLGDEFLRRYQRDPWISPVVTELRRFAAANDGRRLHTLGANLQPLLHCSHPQLLRLAPYEFYEKLLMPDRLAARASEFKLSLAAYFDRTGLPASLLGTLAEPLALEIFRSMHLSDLRDWSSVVSGYANLNEEVVKRVNRESK
jgi:Tfp pilus assembly protein PilF